jgi:hypothetical protein
MINDPLDEIDAPSADIQSFFFLIPQLLVRISEQLSSPGANPRPQEFRSLSDDGTSDWSRFLL